MSNDFDYDEMHKYFLENSTKIEKIDRMLRCRYELYFCLGSTFSLVPEFTYDFSNGVGEIAIDWLYIHIGLNIGYKEGR